MIESVVLAGARTPLGRPFGCLRALSAAQLGAVAVRAALERARVRGDEVDQVLLGHSAIDATDDRSARAAMAGAGIPPGVPLLVIGQMSLSGLNAIAMADRLIRSGTSDIVVAGGMESMTASRRNPDGHAAPPLRLPRRRPLKLDRRTQDEVAALSHERAANAQLAGLFREEIAPVALPDRAGGGVVSSDEGIRHDFDAGLLAAAEPLYFPNGTVTAANTSSAADGAAAVVMMRRSLAEARGLDWLAEVVGHGAVSGRADGLHLQPSLAIRRALAPLDLKVRDLNLIEINESFAAVVVQAMSVLCTGMSRINPHGGAIALGHPTSTSGARIVLHLAHSLQRRGGGLGAAGVCGEAGLGEALLLRSSHR
ncbi:acetyl-CoA C-acyltransferase [Streptomyces sp. NPDC006446]|uniref:thiolase family protein n=1 Tax=Streptomyces sp. NPDC006446 TaxID=3154301 RepID=UPI0033BA75D2